MALLSPRWKRKIDQCAARWWFAPFVGFLSALDAYVFVIPNEPILMAAVSARPKQWLRLSIWTTVGSALGAASLAWLVSLGSDRVLHLLLSEKLEHSHAWKSSLRDIHDYGLWGLAFISFSPLPQHAAVVIAGLVRMKVLDVLLAVLIGRFPKYLGFAYLAAKAPQRLKRWGLGGGRKTPGP